MDKGDTTMHHSVDSAKEANSMDGMNGRDNQLKQTVTISPELYEKIYLQPKGDVLGDIRKVVGNPTPLALIGFVVGLTPLSCELMGWRGSGGGAAATTTDSIWFGGVLLLIAGALEFVLGNTFPFCVFMGYGAHFLTFATTVIPWFNAVGAYNDGSQVQTPAFNAGFGFYTVSMAALSVVFLIVSVRTNAIFVAIFIFAVLGFSLASSAEWYLSAGNVPRAVSLLTGTGACFFSAAMLGWYMLLAVMLAVMEMPGPGLPVFDLSTVIKAKKAPVFDQMA